MSDGGGALKNWLYNWLNRRKLALAYEFRISGPLSRQQFSCELHVDTFSYVGRGSSTSKKDAKTIAANDFMQFLVKQGLIQPDECPHLLVPADSGTVDNTHLKHKELVSIAPSYCSSNEDNIYRPIQHEGRPMSYNYRSQERKALEKTEVVDLTANIHGNWTIDNAKSRLYMFFEENKIKADVSFKADGPNHKKSFLSKMSFFVKQLGRTLYGRETGSTKQAASKSCALTLVRELYHLNVIEAFSGSLRMKKPEVSPPYEVKVSPELETQIDAALLTLNIQSNIVPPHSEGTINLISDVQLDEFQPSIIPAHPSVVQWSPPQPNWNAWTACNLDEGPLANMTLDKISEEMQNSWKWRLQSDEALQKSLQERNALPIAAMKQPILDAVNDNPVVIIRGNTGCGKTTQVCQYILDDYILSGSGAYCNMIVTQPRQVSAVSVADRVASERCEELGQSIGYSVRFDSQLPRPYGSILFCTVRVLLRKLETGLRGVCHVIVDDIHERDINADVILIVLRDMIRAYPNLRIILMSAALDISLFVDYFDNACIIETERTTFPVDQYFLEDFIELSRFKPSAESRKRKRRTSSVPSGRLYEFSDFSGSITKEREYELHGDEPEENLNVVSCCGYSPGTVDAIQLISEKDTNCELIVAILRHINDTDVPGTILVFLPGWTVIAALLQHLQQHSLFGGSAFVILPLHPQLPLEEQRKLFDPVSQGVRKIILATGIAETSITINDVVFVIDSCRTKVKQFTSHKNTVHYATVWASKTNLEQRKRHAGIQRKGMCFLLCSKARFDRLEEHMTPEMYRTPLHEIALSIKLLRLGSVGELLSKAIQAPPIDVITEAEATLRDMKCLDANNDLTPLGKILARLHIEFRLGKMLILGCIFFCGDAMCTFAAHTAIASDVFIIPPKPQLTGNRHSDHVAMLSAFNAWEEARIGGEAAEKSFCDKELLSMSALRETWNAKKQLKELLLAAGFPVECLMPQVYNFSGPDPRLDTLVALLTVGHYPNVCFHNERRKVLIQESKSAMIHNSSVNCVKEEEITFPMPFFVFGIRTQRREISCKQMTMVTPIHLLLMGCCRVEFIDGVVRLDGWLNLTMNPQLAAKIVTLRPAVEALVIRAAKNPQSLSASNQAEDQVINCIKGLLRMNAGRHNMEQLSFESFSSPQPPRHVDELMDDKGRNTDEPQRKSMKHDDEPLFG